MIVEMGAAALGVRFRVVPRDAVLTVTTVTAVAAVAVDVSEAALRAF